jgi:hypothetical protein
MPRPRRPAAPRSGALLLLPILLVAGVAPVQAKTNVVKVTLSVPKPEVIDMTDIRRVLVTRLVVDREVKEFDLGKELVGVMRRDLRQKARLDVLDVDPPPLPEQPLQELLANTGFWRRMAEQYGADLILTGQTSFQVADRSGYVQVDAISPLTGQRIRRSQFVEREAFILDLRVFFLRGSTGELLHEDHFNAEDTYKGQGTDRLAGMFDLYEQMTEDIRGVVAPRWVQVQRMLFKE